MGGHGTNYDPDKDRECENSNARCWRWLPDLRYLVLDPYLYIFLPAFFQTPVTATATCRCHFLQPLLFCCLPIFFLAYCLLSSLPIGYFLPCLLPAFFLAYCLLFSCVLPLLNQPSVRVLLKKG